MPPTKQQLKEEFEQYQLDPLWRQYDLAREEYEAALREYEEQFGYKALDEYTERHI